MKKDKILPPRIFIICLLLSVALHFAWPLVHLIGSPWRYFGVLPLLFGLWINIAADNLFKKYDTTVKPFQKSSALIIEGPFRISRHPMYLGMVIALLGVSILLGSLAAFVGTVLFAVIMAAAFIPHEERDMEETFSEQYCDYRRHVRKWI